MMTSSSFRWHDYQNKLFYLKIMVSNQKPNKVADRKTTKKIELKSTHMPNSSLTFKKCDTVTLRARRKKIKTPTKLHVPETRQNLWTKKFVSFQS